MRLRNGWLLTNAALLTYVIHIYLRIYLPLMAPALVAVGTYALPPIATYYAFRHRMSSGLTMGGVKG